jgi:hypothetical protein
LYVFQGGVYFYYNESVWSAQQMAEQRQKYFTTMNKPTGLPGTSREWGHQWAPNLTPVLPSQTEGVLYSEPRTILYFEPNDANNFGHALMDDLVPLFVAYDRMLPSFRFPLCLIMIESKVTPTPLLLKMGRELVGPEFGLGLEEYAHRIRPAEVVRLESLIAGTATLADHPYEKFWQDYANGRHRGALNFLHGRSSAWFRTFRWMAREIPPGRHSECSVVFLNRGPGHHTRPVQDFTPFTDSSSVVLRPDQMTMKEQIAAVVEADVVVTNCGGGALLAMFAGLHGRKRSSVVLVCGGHEGRLDYAAFDEASWLHPIWYDTERHDCCVDGERLRALISEAKSYSCK